MTTRIELSGRLTRKPEMRVTPAGTRCLKLEADCGDGSTPLLLEILITGDEVTELGRNLHVGERIHALGSLRARMSEARPGGKLGIEVIADRIKLDNVGQGLGNCATSVSAPATAPFRR